MAIRRVALIFDSVQRPETTGVYCLRALKRLVDVEHFQPGELGRMPRTGFDLYLNIDDGLRYHLPADLRPCAWWAIDTHLNFAWCVEKSQDFDLVFAAQRDGAEQLCGAGIATAAWLPLACDPEIHGKHDVAKHYDVAFVGNVFPGPRSRLAELIRRKYPVPSSASVISRTWPWPIRRPGPCSTAVSRTTSTCASSRPSRAGRCCVTNDLTRQWASGAVPRRRPPGELSRGRRYARQAPVLSRARNAQGGDRGGGSRRGHWRSTPTRTGWNGCYARPRMPCRGSLSGQHWTPDVQAQTFNGLWPISRGLTVRPRSRPRQGPLGWLGDGAATALESELTPATRLVVELGSWLGMSARFMADLAPGATVIAIDHWLGSHEHQADAGCRDMLPCALRVVPGDELGISRPHHSIEDVLHRGFGVGQEVRARADLIYFDADHGYDELLDNLDCALRLFPGAVMVGDDFAQPSVARAVADFAARHDMCVELAGDDWKAWKLVARSCRYRWLMLAG